MEGDLVTTRQRIDYLGVNYYTPMYITHDPQSLLGAWFGARPPNMPSTAMDWPIDATGLTEGLIRLRDHYGNPEVYVTENGACFNDLLGADGTVSDVDRIAYLRAHLAAAQDAITAGVKLHGYFVWSLLDNFEWQEGYSRRFGVIYVDFKTLKRTPKRRTNGWQN
jgi:beta-glucosidase